MITRTWRTLTRNGRWRYLLSGFILVTSVLLATMVIASLRRPAWYRPSAIDFTHLQDDKRELVGLYDRISGALNAGREIEIEIDETRLNRWIAAHNEFWPHLDAQFASVVDPYLKFCDGNRVQVAATFAYPHSAWRTVGGACIELDVPARVRGRFVRFELGTLGVPAGLIWPVLAPHLTPRAVPSVELNGTALEVFNEWVWENGRAPFRIRDIRVSDGKAWLTFAPLAAR